MSETTTFTKRSFGSTGASGPDGTTGDDDREPDVDGDEIDQEPVSTKAIITTVILFVLALGCFIGAIGFTDTQPRVSQSDEKEIFALREQIQSVKADSQSLPESKDADRTLVRALDAASDVSGLQNNYRFLASETKAGDGKLDPSLTQDISRSLIPYFDPSVDRALLDPWYLLTTDADVPDGIGLPETFDSGYEWQPQVPSMINKDGSVSVSWIAVQTRTNNGSTPVVLAWAQADYDATRQVFTDVQVGTTSSGKALGLEVKH